MLPAVYSNFVMFAPGELTPLVHARVPLFNGKIPAAAGTLQQSVQDALAAILKEKGFADASVQGIEFGNPVTAYAFSITNPLVQIHAVHVDAVSPTAQAKVAEIQKAFVDTDYDAASEAAVRSRLLDAYHDLAFLDAEIAPPLRTAPTTEANRILVDISTSVQEGSQYRLSKLELPVTPIVPAAELQQAAGLKPGDLATRIGLLATASHINRQFTHRGYMDSKVAATQTKDPATHTVAYALTVDPGQLFHLRAVHAVNLNEQQQKDFDANWKLPPGSAYDEEYVATFLRKNTAIKSLQGFSAGYKAAAFPDTGLVDLTITFVKGGTMVH
jgi:outer membrane protein insertion porin family